MGRIILVTGGSRSGKSSYAQRYAESLPGPRTYIATSPVIDPEMEARIRKHRLLRSASNWKTVEETIDLAAVVGRCRKENVVLVDCLTLWINNIMHEAHRLGRDLKEEDIERESEILVDTCRTVQPVIIFVANEIGMGIVPDNPVSRLFRDLVGRCNQVVAAAADSVVLVVSGIPLKLKGSKLI
ncbi:MAG: bifunctional adenosylcobinamide kinase/adenosylcobinamide-phosphate guanylyltransferase [Syntrophales bacterium]